MSEPNAEETKKDDQTDRNGFPDELSKKAREERRKKAEKKRVQIDPKTLFSTEPLLDQLEMQIGLLTSAMSQNMILATGVCPGLTEPIADGEPKNVWLKPKAGPAGNAFADARSLHLRDAARLSFATASLIGAYAKLKGPPRQRISARYTLIPEPGNRNKTRTITTITHHAIAGVDASLATRRG